MSKRLKWFIISSSALFSFVLALTIPTIHLYFVQRVDSQAYIVAGILSTALAALINSVLSKENIRQTVRKIIAAVLLVDAVGYLFISLYYIDNVNVRFIGISVLTATTTTIWMVVMMDAINHKIGDVELTNFKTIERACTLWANVIGGLFALVVVDVLRLEYAIIIQGTANCLYALCDLKALSLLKEA